MTRLTDGGAILGPDGRIGFDEALDLYLAPLGDPGVVARRLRVGAAWSLTAVGARSLREPAM